MLEQQGTAVPDGSVDRYLDMFSPALIQNILCDAQTTEDLILNNVGQSLISYVDMDEPDGVTMRVRFYEDGLPLMIGQSACGGAVQMSSILVNADGLAECRNAADVQNWLNARSIPMIIASDEPASMPPSFPHAQGDTMAEKALWIARNVVSMMRDPDYTGFVIGDADHLTERLLQWSAGDFTAPRLMLHAELSESTCLQVFGAEAISVFADENDRAAQMLLNRLPKSTLSSLLIRSGGGTEELAAMSVASSGTIYADLQQSDGMGIYFLLYEEENAMAVCWQAANGVVRLSGCYLAIPEISEIRSSMEMTMWLMKKGLPMPCTEIQMNK